MEIPASGGNATSARSRLFRRASDLPRISLTHPESDATITYTLDGSEPGPDDAIYSGPIEILATTVLRAKAFAPNAIPSPAVTRTYISSEGVLSQLTGNPAPFTYMSSGSELFDPALAAAYGHTQPPQRSGYPASGSPSNPGTKTIVEQLEARPAIFLTFDSKSLLYNSPGGSSDPETPASFEWVDPARPSDYRQENSFVQLTGGNASSQFTKKSFDVLFKGSTTLTGKSRWDGPVLGSGAQIGTSAIFPGSRVTSFPRLLLRNPSQASFVNTHGPSDKTYINDAWMKETQRALGGNAPFTTVQRRWVHVFINGYYWGVYDLEEHFDSDTISAHLLAALPANTSSTVKDQYKSSLIYAGQPGRAPDYSTQAVISQWWDQTARAKAADVYYSSSTTRASKFSALESVIDIDAYIDYITTLQVVDHAELNFDNVRAWRHPVTQKWYVMAWDGDLLGWGFSNNYFINDVDNFDPAIISDQAVHRAVKLKPEYVARFASRLQTHLTGPLSFSAMSARFNSLAEDFRLTLECESLRWGRFTLDGSNKIPRWEEDISYLKPLLLDPHPPADGASLFNNLVKSAKLPGYLPANYPLLPPP